MRYLFLGIIFCVAACNAQPAKKQAQIDTVRLFDPFPSNKEDMPQFGMYKNTITAFIPNGYGVISDSDQVVFNNLSEVSAYIAKNAITIKQTKFYIIIDSSTRFDKTVSIIDILKKNKIDNYRVINYQQYFSPSEKIEVTMPTVVITTVKEDDSTVFSIALLPKAIEVKVREKAATLKNAKELDAFITKNKSLINPNKITITGDRDVPYDKFKPVVEVMKKHEYYKFSMISK